MHPFVVYRLLATDVTSHMMSVSKHLARRRTFGQAYRLRDACVGHQEVAEPISFHIVALIYSVLPTGTAICDKHPSGRKEESISEV